MSFTAPDLPRELYGEANIRLGKIEAAHNVTIIYALESGSRAWGFPSPDSDNDVRFFYVRPLSQYLGLHQLRDVIECPMDGLWDVNGWDLRKALGALTSGNATVAEWLSSPLIYREYGPLPFKLRTLLKQFATPQQSARHYYGLTNTIYKRDIEQGVPRDGARIMKDFPEVNMKKYLYAIRSSMAIAWIAKFDEIPPMTVPALKAQDIMSWDVRGIINDLLDQKKLMGEIGKGKRIPILDDYIEEQMAWVRSKGFEKLKSDPEFNKAAEQLLLDALGVG